MTRRLRPSAAPRWAARGAVAALAVTALLAASPVVAQAAESDDATAAAPAGSQVIAVVVPPHEMPAGVPPRGTGPDDLAHTGQDAGALWAAAVAAVGAIGVGGALVAHRRRRARG